MDTRTAETKTLEALHFLPSKGEHPMLDIPFVIGIDGRQYRGVRLSLVMAEISGLMDPALERANRLMRLVFPFNGFSVTLEVLGKIQSVDRDKGSAIVSFVEPGGEHLPQMRHILNSYIANDLVALGDVIGVGATMPSPAARTASQRKTSGQFARRLLGSAAMILATLALAGLVGSLAHDRILTQHIAAAGRVEPEGLMLDAVTAGQLDYVNLNAAPGEVAFTIRSTSGELLSIAMPCDCTAALVGAVVGSTLQAGEPVLSVHDDAAAIIVTAEVAAEDMLKLAFADHAEVRFADGEVIRATVDPDSLRAASGRGTTPVRLIPETALPASRAGQLAELTLIRPFPINFGPAGDAALERLSSVLGQ